MSAAFVRLRNGRTRNRVFQRGMTLIEWMVSITVGLFLVTGMAVLIASQSATRAELDRSGQMIESGRYALQTLADDLLLAGYWGETSQSEFPAIIVDWSDESECWSALNLSALSQADLNTLMPLRIAVRGYNDASPSGACLSNYKSNTDVLIVRRANIEAVEVSAAKNKPGQIYLQTGLPSAAATAFTYKLNVAANTDVSNLAFFDLLDKNGAPAKLRAIELHIYYVSTCGECGGDSTPTLKMRYLTYDGGSPAFKSASLVEGIENLQIDFGRDSTGDGIPDFVNDNGVAFSEQDWSDVVSVNLNVLARAIDMTVGYQDAKAYTLGTKTLPKDDAPYRRHVFSRSVRLENPASRRTN